MQQVISGAMLALKLVSAYFLIVALFALKSLSIVIYSGVLYAANGILFPIPRANPKTRFACVIAARNEERVIGELVQSLLRQNYPKTLFDIYVMPNNCTDHTALAAIRTGAAILKPRGEVRCKGDALHEAFETLLRKDYDAFCVFDADNVVDADFLLRMNDAFLAGARVTKGAMRVKNPQDSPLCGCYGLYFTCFDFFFSRARMNCGLSSKLVGTGFAVHRSVLEQSGGWNGGFAPYGYRLEKGELSIADDEVEVIRVIFDRFIHTNDGVAGIARYLNTHGYVKKLRQNGTIPKFSAVFVRGILDNPIYCGKIAFGRRKVEKKLGTRNEMHVVKQSEFPVYVGQHEAIVSEDDWNLAQTKRQRTTGRREKVRDPDHAHILSGILKCLCCGRNLYGNVSKAHSKDNKTRYYYFCKSIKGQTGHECSFRLNIEQNEINQMVASIVSAMVHDPRFVDAIKEKIGSAVDTSELEHQADTIKAQLRQRLSTKSRLEHQMDTLDFNDPYYDRKALDLQRRYDEQYELIEDMETQLAEIQGQIDDIHQEKITADNIYHLLLAFDEVYNAATEVEQKEFMRAFIERIDIFPEKQPNGNWIRNIVFAFPVPYNGKEIREFPLELQSTVEVVSCYTKTM